MLLKAQMEKLAAQLETFRALQAERTTQSAELVRDKAGIIAYPLAVIEPEHLSFLKKEEQTYAQPLGNDVQLNSLDGKVK